jgi:myo-inositol 2-dehydrogenase / D-chiro-inositol 1-dehydrogenase
MTEPTNRRAFLKASAASVATAAVVLPGAYAGAGNDILKVGLIGCGDRGSGAAKQAMRADPKVKLVAMCDAFQDRLDTSLGNLKNIKDIAAKIDVAPDQCYTGFDGYQKLLKSDVDVVILTTPPGFRPIHLRAAVEAGKHVFFEKPVAVDVPGIKSVIESAKLAKEKGTGLCSGYCWRYDQPKRETVKRIHDGEIGDVMAIHATYFTGLLWDRGGKDKFGSMEYQMRNWYYFNWLCGDHIVEQHIHNLDVINWLKGAYPVRAEGMGGRQVRVGSDYGEIYDHHAVEFEYADGSRMFSYCRHIPNCWDSVTEHAIGTNGTADLSASRIRVKGWEEWRYRGEKRNAYQVEHDDLFASIRAGTPLNEAENGARSSMTSILGRMATYSGKMITWDKAIASEINLAPKEYAWNASPPVPVVATPGVTQVV